MNSAAILYCLHQASSEAETQNLNAPLDIGKTYLWRAAQLRFGLTSARCTVTEDDLNWGDVIKVCDGLTSFFQGSGQWQEMNFYIQHRRRGALGAGAFKLSRWRIAGRDSLTGDFGIGVV